MNYHSIRLNLRMSVVHQANDSHENKKHTHTRTSFFLRSLNLSISIYLNQILFFFKMLIVISVIIILYRSCNMNRFLFISEEEEQNHDPVSIFLLFFSTRCEVDLIKESRLPSIKKQINYFFYQFS
jgi:hypothetical protein